MFTSWFNSPTTTADDITCHMKFTSRLILNEEWNYDTEIRSRWIMITVMFLCSKLLVEGPFKCAKFLIAVKDFTIVNEPSGKQCWSHNYFSVLSFFLSYLFWQIKCSFLPSYRSVNTLQHVCNDRIIFGGNR